MRRGFSKLSVVVNVSWYAAITAAIMLFIGSVFYLYCSLSGSDIDFPAVTFKHDIYSYSFNTKYLAIYNLDEILEEFIEHETGDVLTSSHTRYRNWKMPYLQSLYDLPPIPEIFRNSLKNSRVRVSINENYPFLISTFAKVKNEPEFIVSIFLIITSYLFFGLMIIYNIRKIISAENPVIMFTNDNSDSIKYIGIYIILSEVIKNLLFYWMNSSIIKGIGHFINDTLFIKTYAFSWTEINYNLIFVGIITLILSEIFRVGANLKEDVDLTI